MKIKKVLIANRGEIAVRIIDACSELGIKTVAVHSSADKDGFHTERTDEAHYIGEAPASESYLNQGAIIAVAQKTKCDAIHPGYGFLAENSAFAEKVTNAGIIFIGPPAKAIADMGDKTVARKIMQDAGVPVVPGTVDPVRSFDEIRKEAKKIGYPVLIKAAGGGGGKGMRRVNTASGLKEGYERAVSEASSSFGNPSVYLEKYLENPRHIEFQILGDHYGNVIHLGERECSIQRRHQKVIEECPSPTLTPEERMRFGETAVKAAKACGYTNAGTVEFLMDRHRNFYFLEMNTRLQVEHPVTEYVTGIDIVFEQFRIASGERLAYRQEDITWRGHAVECRIYAEDPYNDFYPSVGYIQHLRRPIGKGIRIDSGIEENSEISVYYDPLLAKMICHGQTREGAIQRSIKALDDYIVFGVKTNIAFCRFVLQSRRFQSGTFDTNFVEESFKPEYINQFSKKEKAMMAAAAAYYKHKNRPAYNNNSYDGKAEKSAWKSTGLRDAMR
ncbi:acetyl/propionyl/methylcrotonyl-CoA carboxylase subunit alpha [candidate division KSB1 bacterium]